jgi:hypothetical protein
MTYEVRHVFVPMAGPALDRVNEASQDLAGDGKWGCVPTESGALFTFDDLEVATAFRTWVRTYVT